jgi:hypothetical protein
VSAFTSELNLRPLPDGIHWVLIDEFSYYTDDGLLITVPAGFVTDFASVPRFLWALFPPWGKYGKAAVLHDFLYWLRLWSRGRCDAEFLEGMVILGVCWRTRTAMYAAVRAFGWLAWRKARLPQRVAMPEPEWIGEDGLAD